jgi:hypothetical protein
MKQVPKEIAVKLQTTKAAAKEDKGNMKLL